MYCHKPAVWLGGLSFPVVLPHCDSRDTKETTNILMKKEYAIAPTMMRVRLVFSPLWPQIFCVYITVCYISSFSMFPVFVLAKRKRNLCFYAFSARIADLLPWHTHRKNKSRFLQQTPICFCHMDTKFYSLVFKPYNSNSTYMNMIFSSVGCLFRKPSICLSSFLNVVISICHAPDLQNGISSQMLGWFSVLLWTAQL